MKTIFKDNRTFAIILMKMLHFFVVVAMFSVCFVLYYRPWFESENALRFRTLMCAFYAVVFYLLSRTYYFYDIAYKRPTDLFFAQTLSCTISAAICYFLNIIAWSFHYFSPIPLLVLLVLQIAFNWFWSKLANRLYSSLVGKKQTCIVYKSESDLNHFLSFYEYKDSFNLAEFLDSKKTTENDILKALDGYDAVFALCLEKNLSDSIAKYCITNGVQGFFEPQCGDVILAGAEHVTAFSLPLISVERANPDVAYSIVKRFMDILFSVLAIAVLSPILIITAVAVKLCDFGPIFYRQKRLTKDGKVFNIIKFRSMRVDAEADGVARLSTENDSRITPVGRIIRACRIDELPQLFNILHGEMTIVGPRPERPEISAEYEKTIPEFPLRLQVKAGLTGYAQIYGRYNSTPYEKLLMDLMYINKMSVIEDIKLMFATVRILFLKESTEGLSDGKNTAL